MSAKYGKWEVLRPLKEGGQAHTFLVRNHDGADDEQWVLKRLKNPKRHGRFKTEVEALKKIVSPHVLSIVDYDLEAEKPYFVTQFAEGGSLQDYLETNGPFELLPGLRLFETICEGVKAAHGQNVIHRDLKPDNIFLGADSQAAIVGDFGLCFVANGERQTILDEAVGARLYMAPENEDGRTEEVSERSDVYSLGKILWRLFSGRQAFSREGYRESPNDLVVLKNESQFERINRLLDRMIVKDPGGRFSGVHILLQRVKDTIRLVEGNYNVVGFLGQRCTYCGEGFYQKVASTHTENRNAGLNVAGGAFYHIFSCRECGHVQFFNLHGANKAQEWWGLKPEKR